MTSTTSQELESYLPVFDAVPEKWDDARPFLVEHFKKISNAVNAREIGFHLDEELLSGKSFIPGASIPGNNPGIFRSVFRKVIDVHPLVPGLNTFLHGILFDNKFTLIDLWVCGTNSTSLTARRITGNDVIMNATQLLITSPQAFDRAFAFIEYIQEL